MLVKVAVGGLVLMLGVVGTLGVAVQRGGILYVEVEDRREGIHLRLPVPLVLADAALAFIPDEGLVEARHELAEAEPVLRALLQELPALEDATFVEVTSGEERVLVYKEGTDFIVDVETDQESVYVRIPLHAVERVVGKVAGW